MLKILGKAKGAVGPDFFAFKPKTGFGVCFSGLLELLSQTQRMGTEEFARLCANVHNLCSGGPLLPSDLHQVDFCASCAWPMTDSFGVQDHDALIFVHQISPKREPINLN
jgi:hypothetical protein